MGNMITILAASLLSLGALAADAVNIDKGVSVVICGASTLESESALALEAITELNIYAIDVLSGEQIDAGHFSSPFSLVKTSTIKGIDGRVTNFYDVVGSTSEKATVIFEVGATPADVKVVGVTIGTSIFLAPVLTKDQATTDSIVKAGNAGFSCSSGVADVQWAISDLAF